MTNEEDKEFLRIQRAGIKEIMASIYKNEKLELKLQEKNEMKRKRQTVSFHEAVVHASLVPEILQVTLN